MTRKWFLAGWGLTAGLSSALGGRICDPAAPQTHAVDPTMVGIDAVPPEWTNPPAVGFQKRGQGAAGCGDGDQCDAIGTLFVTVAATDDRTPPQSIRYRLQLVSGTPPRTLHVPDHDVRPLGSYGIPLAWNDSATDSQEAFSFTLSLAPVDLAGNVGESRTLTIADPGTGGCAVGGGGLGALWPAVLLALLLRTSTALLARLFTAERDR
jgi:hypothetical protein